MGISHKFHFVLCALIMGCDTARDPLIVGGEYTKISKYPHCVYLSVDCSSQSTCGASILNQNILLTAAHCVKGCRLKNPRHMVEAFAGHEDVDKMQSERRITMMRVHKKYDSYTTSNDIALLGFKKSLRLGKNIKRIIFRSWFPKVSKAIVAGWGVSENSKDGETSLKVTTQKIRSKKVCSQMGRLHSGTFCAGSRRSEVPHAAEGDSGSALFTKKFVQIGIVSYGCDRFPALTVYTNVSYYYEWIKKNVKSLYREMSV